MKDADIGYKEPWAGVFYSFVYPGLGQIYIREYGIGLFFIIITTLTMIHVVSNILFYFEPTTVIESSTLYILVLSIILLSVFHLLIAIYSYRRVIRYNRLNNLIHDTTRKKSPWFAGCLSWILPGLGQIYNGNIFKAIFFLSLALLVKFKLNNYFLSPLFNSILPIFATMDSIKTAIRINRPGDRIINQVYYIRYFTLLFVYIFTVNFLTRHIFVNKYEILKIKNNVMSPTISAEDWLLIDKTAYRNDLPQKGDIVMFKGQGIPSLRYDKCYIKRIIGLQGDTILIKDEKITIGNETFDALKDENGNLIKIPTSVFSIELASAQKSKREFVIPKGYYFVLGDNFEVSKDSRYWGYLPYKNIIGKVTKIIYPFNHSKIL